MKVGATSADRKLKKKRTRRRREMRGMQIQREVKALYLSTACCQVNAIWVFYR